MGKGLPKRKYEKLRKKQNLKSLSKIKKKIFTAKKIIKATQTKINKTKQKKPKQTKR